MQKAVPPTVSKVREFMRPTAVQAEEGLKMQRNLRRDVGGKATDTAD